MKNREIAKIFNEIAEYLEMDGVRFKPYAYQKAAITLENLKDSVEDIYQPRRPQGLEGHPRRGREHRPEDRRVFDDRQNCRITRNTGKNCPSTWTS